MFAEAKPAQFITLEKGHGRLEERQVRVSGELMGYSDFPGLKQVAEVKKRVVIIKTGEVRDTQEYLISSLSPEQAPPEKLLGLIRGHWGIENRLFHVKDDSFGEDRQVLGRHHSGEVMSLLKATAINLLRGRSYLWKDADPLSARAQYLCARPLAAFQLTT